MTKDVLLFLKRSSEVLKDLAHFSTTAAFSIAVIAMNADHIEQFVRPIVRSIWERLF